MNENLDESKTRKVFSIGINEVELLSNVINERIGEYEIALTQNQSGDVSLIELIDHTEEGDAQYVLDSFKELKKRIKRFQTSNEKNDVNFLEETPMFRCEERVETYRLRHESFDRIVYVHISRHGVYFFYKDLEALVGSYTSGPESNLRFDSITEIENYMAYWKGN